MKRREADWAGYGRTLRARAAANDGKRLAGRGGPAELRVIILPSYSGLDLSQRSMLQAPFLSSAGSTTAGQLLAYSYSRDSP